MTDEQAERIIALLEEIASQGRRAPRRDRKLPAPRPEDHADAARTARRYARAPWRKTGGE